MPSNRATISGYVDVIVRGNQTAVVEEIHCPSGWIRNRWCEDRLLELKITNLDALIAGDKIWRWWKWGHRVSGNVESSEVKLVGDEFHTGMIKDQRRCRCIALETERTAANPTTYFNFAIEINGNAVLDGSNFEARACRNTQV